MKQFIAETEKAFVVEGFQLNLRTDGRSNTDLRESKVLKGTIAEAFGSSTVSFGEQETQILCVIKADV